MSQSLARSSLPNIFLDAECENRLSLQLLKPCCWACFSLGLDVVQQVSQAAKLDDNDSASFSCGIDYSRTKMRTPGVKCRFNCSV
jgi:hypothetical protein